MRVDSGVSVKDLEGAKAHFVKNFRNFEVVVAQHLFSSFEILAKTYQPIFVVIVAKRVALCSLANYLENANSS